MDSIFEHYKKTGYLHHAHVIEGVHKVVAPLLLTAITKHLNIDTRGNPDVMVQFFNPLGIDEARLLKEAQTRSAFSNTRKIFILGTNSFTHEAQNALLKTFEEPTHGTHFFIILPRAEMLLPTLRSRVLVVQSHVVCEDEAKELAEKFLNASLEERFAMAKKLAEKKAGDTVDRELFRRVFDHIERILYTRTVGKNDNTTANVFQGIFKAKTYLADRGSSPKMLMDHLAIVIPAYEPS